MAIARITDIKGLVTLGGDNEEILKNKDEISDHGGILTIGEFAKIIFSDGREVDVSGPVTFKLDSSFFNEGTFEDSITQISDLASLDYIDNALDTNQLEDLIINSDINQNTTDININSEQVDPNLNITNNQTTILDAVTNNNPTVQTVQSEQLSTSAGTTTPADGTNNNTDNNNQTGADTPANTPDTETFVTVQLDSTSDTGISDSDGITKDSTPTFIGTGEVGATIVITSSTGEVLASTVVGADGTYSITTSELSDGEQTLTVTATDAAGNTDTITQTLTIDTSANAGEVTVNTIGSDDVINAQEAGEATQTVSGTAIGGDISAGDVVTVSVNGNDYITTVDENGNYSVEVNTSDLVTDTNVNVSISSTDTAGNVVESSSSHTIISDVEIGTPSISFESTGEDTIYNAEEVGSDGTITASIDVSGSSAGDSLTYTVDGVQTTVVLSADDIANGVSVEVSPGAEVSATLSDAAGNESATATGTAADADVDTSVTASLDSASDTGVSNSDGLTKDNTPTINGTGEVGATVVISTVTGEVVGTGVVGANGTYSITTSELSDGEQNLTITATDTAGNTDTTTETISIDTQGPTIIVDDTSVTEDTAQTIGHIDSLDGTLNLDESSAANGTISVDDNGNIIYTPDENYSGTDEVNLVVSDDAGNVTTQTVDLAVAAVADAPSLSIEVGEGTVVTTRTETVKSGTTELCGGDGTDNYTDEPTVQEYTQTLDYGPEYAGQTITVTMDVHVTGTWDAGYHATDDTFTVEINGQEHSYVYGAEHTGINLDDNHSYTYSVTLDENGQAIINLTNASTGSDEIVEVNSITSTHDLVESEIDYPIDISSALADADGSEELTITIDGVPEGASLNEGTKNPDGTWTITVDGDSYDGTVTMRVPSNVSQDFSITATATATETANGDTSSVSQSADIDAVDIIAPDVDDLSITDIQDNNGDYSSVTMSGTGSEVGNTITIYDENGDAVATAIVQENGTWSADISKLSGTGINDNEFFSISETDAAGNETAQTDTTHYWHGTWRAAVTESTDDYVMAGSGNDTIYTDATLSSTNENGPFTTTNDDTNDKVVIDGGDGNDTVVFGKDFSEYTISKDEDGNIIVTENSSSDSNGDGIGDATELRNVETIKFADGTYSAEDLLDDTASAPTLNMDISDVNVVEGSANLNLEANGTEDYSNGSIYDSDRINDLEFNDIYSANINMADGDDTLTASGNVTNGSIYMGSGDDTLYVEGDVIGEYISTDSFLGGNDTVVIDGKFSNASLVTGGGNDYVQIGDLGSSNIHLGSGDDVLKLSGSQDDYHIHDNGFGTYLIEHNGQWASVTGADAIIFEDGSYLGDASLAEQYLNTETTYQYNITFDAGLTDTDGSESLSNITLNNLPDGASLQDSNGNEIMANDDGSYTVQVDNNGNANVTLVCDTEVGQDSLNDITASVTSTEHNGGDSATTTVNDEGEIDLESLELDFDNIDSSSADFSGAQPTNSNADNLDLSDMLSQDSTDSLSNLLGESENPDATTPDDSSSTSTNGSNETSSEDSYDPFQALDESSSELIAHIDIDSGSDTGGDEHNH